MGKTNARKLAETLVSAMDTENIEAIRRHGAGEWRESIDGMRWDFSDGERPDTGDVITEIEKYISEISRQRSGPKTIIPPLGGPRVTVRWPQDLLDLIDDMARESGLSRSQMILDLIYLGLETIPR
jgi:hypothetical protein